MRKSPPAAQDRDELIRKMAHHLELAAVHLVDVTRILAGVAQDLAKLQGAEDGPGKEAVQ